MRPMLFLSHLGMGFFCLALTMMVHQDAGAANPYPGFKVGVQSYCFRNFDLDGALKNTQELGLKNIEFYSKHASHTMTPEQLNEVKAKLKKAGIRVVAYGVVGFGGDEEANEKIFKFAQEMGIKVITADPAPESFASLDKLVKKYNIKVAIHNHGPGSRYSSLEDVLNAIEGHDRRIGACIDNGHFQRSGVDAAEATKKLGKRVHAVHLKDLNAENHDQVLGQGAADIPAFLEALKEVGFNGPLNLEYEIEPDNPVPSMKKCLEYLEGVCKGTKKADPASAAKKCIQNLISIDNAKERWALENLKLGGDPVIEAEVNKYIKGGKPKCPSGGTYTYGKIGEDPRCSIPGHQM
jgi:inosose dehydratase